MKRFVSLLVATAMLSLSVISVSAADVSYMADFESNEAKFGKSTVYKGFKNTAGDYEDFVTPVWVDGEGKDGTTGLEINYKSATWYAGEIFFPIPAVWENGEGAEYLNFDYKGTGRIKINLSTGNKDAGTLTSGTRYGYTLVANTNGEWESVSVPLSSFIGKTSDPPLSITDIGCVTIQAGENANLNNNAAETKAMTKEELEEKAKAGSIVLDNMELSSSATSVQPSEGTPTPAPTAAPVDNAARIIDFDKYSLSQKQTWGGFKNNAGDYNDFIKFAITDEGKDGKGMKLNYQAATWYSGEVFCAIPKDWAVDAYSEYLEFEAKGHAILKIALETGEVINGTRYEQRVDIDTNGEWKKYSIPISKFVKGSDTVTLSDVTGMTFKATESGNLNNNATETKEMSKADLEAKAKYGEVVIDNITLSESYTASPIAKVSISQNKTPLASLSQATKDGGAIKIDANILNCNENQSVILIAAIYENGRLIDVKTGGETVIENLGTTSFNVNVPDPENKSMKVFVLESTGNIRPLTESVKF